MISDIHFIKNMKAIPIYIIRLDWHSVYSEWGLVYFIYLLYFLFNLLTMFIFNHLNLFFVTFILLELRMSTYVYRHIYWIINNLYSKFYIILCDFSLSCNTLKLIQRSFEASYDGGNRKVEIIISADYTML